ncbi:chromosome partitioning protein ParB [Salmonella enterica]|nr:chromosome partitioning protein ParB [Salmonella enterica]EAX6603599.1 chromosome partitioning protein ParB [Salmonella enterica]
MEISLETIALKVVTLDNLRPFDLNPRRVRNPLYNEIKESIRQRGLEQQLQITQRPGESFFIISNGGNTRLSILSELWHETHDKKYWEFSCLYQKWQAENVDEGNLHFLLSHLIENDMHGSLTYIERALGVQKAASLYSSVYGRLSLEKMSQYLRNEGYPVSPSEISRMEATVSLLLPHIPEPLYGGLSRTTIEQLLRLRSNTGKYWESCCKQMSADEEKQLPFFDDVFAMALLPFNTQPGGFHVEHIQDELTGLVSQALNVDYNSVALITDAQAQKRSSILGMQPVPELPAVSEQRAVELFRHKEKSVAGNTIDVADENDSGVQGTSSIPGRSQDTNADEAINSITFAEPAEDTTSSTSCPPSSLPGDDPWYIDPLIDTQEGLASLIDQTVWELAEMCGLEYLVTPAESGTFTVSSPPDDLSNEGQIYWQLLAFMAGQLSGNAAAWHQTLLGSETIPAIFSDDFVMKVMQLIRFIRRLNTKGGA